MLDERAIRASSARHLNDATELDWAFHVVQDVIDGEGIPDDPDSEFVLSEVLGLMDDLREVWDVFVFSLSEQGDQLSQWRAYTSGGDGYSIGFDAHTLRDFARGSKFHLARCEYAEESQHGLVRDILSEAGAYTVEQRKNGVDRAQARVAAVGLIMEHLIVTLPVLKHPAFVEEKEWRLIHPITSIWSDHVKYRDGGRLVVPYLKMESTPKQIPIHKVRIGPTPHREIEARTMSGLLTVHGLKDATVEHSEVPFRDW